MALTSAFVNTIKKPGKHHDKQGTGLFLLVRPTGGRFGSQRVVIHGKRRELGLGSPPTVTLAEAREGLDAEDRQAFRNGLIENLCKMPNPAPELVGTRR